MLRAFNQLSFSFDGTHMKVDTSARMQNTPSALESFPYQSLQTDQTMELSFHYFVYI